MAVLDKKLKRIGFLLISSHVIDLWIAEVNANVAIRDIIV